MKVYLIAYLNKNFGDDLFIDLLVKRYPNAKFTLISYTKPYFKYKNVKVLYMNIFRRFFNKFLKVLSGNRYDINNFIGNKNDIVITIGGSLFMESPSSFNCLFYNSFKKPYYILGSNIGPIYTKKYLDFIYKNILDGAEDVCFRDLYSYNLFKENNNNNFRYSTDIIFSLNLNNYNLKKQNDKKVIISVIDINKKIKQTKNLDETKYIELINKIIKYFNENDYIIELISFCENEGDMEMINKIKNENESCFSIYEYDGNIEKIISELSTASTIVGSRFHANILGFLLNKNVIPIIYNDKTKNMLKDIDFNGKFFDLEDENISSFCSFELGDIKYIQNIKIQKEHAKEHFKEIDKII